MTPRPYRGRHSARPTNMLNRPMFPRDCDAPGSGPQFGGPYPDGGWNRLVGHLAAGLHWLDGSDPGDPEKSPEPPVPYASLPEESLPSTSCRPVPHTGDLPTYALKEPPMLTTQPFLHASFRSSLLRENGQRS